jgi:hypothetical protein
MEFLWLKKGSMPAEMLELTLCRDVYHCPPDQFPPLSTILRHLTVLGIESEVQDMKTKQAAAKVRRRG